MKRIPQGLIAVFVSIAFAVLIGLGIVASSLIFQPEKIQQDPFGFWLSVGIKVVIQIVAFNLAYFIYMASKKGDFLSNLMQAFKNYSNFVKYVYKACLQQKVRDRIKVVNRERFVESADTMLENITESLHYNDLFVEEKDKDGKVVSKKPVDVKKLVDERAKQYELTNKEIKRLRAIIVNIINGRKVVYQKVEYDTLMIGSDKVKNKHTPMEVSEGGMLVVKNVTMVISACVLAILTSIFILGAINGEWIYQVLSSLFTIIVSVSSAIIYGVIVVNKLIRAYCARRDFFNDFIELPEEKQENQLQPTAP